MRESPDQVTGTGGWSPGQRPRPQRPCPQPPRPPARRDRCALGERRAPCAFHNRRLSSDARLPSQLTTRGSGAPGPSSLRPGGPGPTPPPSEPGSRPPAPPTSSGPGIQALDLSQLRPGSPGPAPPTSSGPGVQAPSPASPLSPGGLGPTPLASDPPLPSQTRGSKPPAPAPSDPGVQAPSLSSSDPGVQAPSPSPPQGPSLTLLSCLPERKCHVSRICVSAPWGCVPCLWTSEQSLLSSKILVDAR